MSPPLEDGIVPVEHIGTTGDDQRALTKTPIEVRATQRFVPGMVTRVRHAGQGQTERQGRAIRRMGKMPTLKEYHKPTEVSAALTLLQRQSPPTVLLAGGTWLTPRLGKEIQAGAVVDLSGLGLDGIERDPDTLRLGPMATLAEVTRDDTCRSLASGILARTAKRD
ncbi:MAG: hypothetical protein GQ526_07340, partial [Ardenticatenales bacterium]|nr:hypothetical protein [Ardenticatenales bacterium]